MKRKYILPELSFETIRSCDVITLSPISIYDLAGDIGENIDGNVDFAD